MAFLEAEGEGRRSVGEIRRAFRKRYVGTDISVSLIRSMLAEMSRSEQAAEREWDGLGMPREALQLPNHRKPDGTIDWEGVPGYVNFKREARRAAREALKEGRVGASLAGT
jgi:hypothetical protein